MADEPKPVQEILEHIPGEGGREVDLEDTIATDEQISAKEDAALNELLADVEEEHLPALEPQEEEPAAEAEPEPEPEPAPEPETTPDRETDEYRLAAASLRRDGWKTEDLALLPAERVLAMAEHRIKVQNDIDDAYSELVRLRAEGKPPGERTGSKNDAEATPATPDGVAPIAELLDLDAEGAQVLADWHARAQAPLLERLAHQDQSVEKAVGSVYRLEAELARRDLGERFPQVRDASADGFKRVLNRMNTLQKAGDYDNVRQLMEDAVLIEFRDEMKAEAADASKKIRTARAKGQSETATTAIEEPRAFSREEEDLDPEERDDRVLDILDRDEPGSYQERLRQAKRVGGSSY